MRWIASLVFVVGCGSTAHPDAGAPDRDLGMNDVTMLVPLPADRAQPQFLSITGEGTPLVPRDKFTQLVTEPRDIAPKLGDPITYEDFQVVGIRFDLCLHDLPAPCAPDETGRVRLVLQPLYTALDGKTAAHDVAIHAFYPIPPEEMADVVGELRVLSKMQNLPLDTPLQVSNGLADPDGDYAIRLRALVTTYAREDRMVRLTVMGQAAGSAAFEWILRGIHKGDAGWDPITIPEARTTKQELRDNGGDTIYEITPSVDAPVGFSYAINADLFNAAGPDDQRYALEAIATVLNPDMRGAGNTQCASCHIATFLMNRRAQKAGIDPATLASEYKTSYNVSINGVVTTDNRVVRALGWAGSQPVISQRVAYDTAALLTELSQRFPVTKR